MGFLDDGVFVGSNPQPIGSKDLGELGGSGAAAPGGFAPSTPVPIMPLEAIASSYWAKASGVLFPATIGDSIAIGRATAAFNAKVSVEGDIYALGFILSDTVRITKDGSDNLVFTDPVSGSKTLAQIIAAAGGDVLVADGGTFSDWFLPSKDELNAIKTVLYDFGSGGFLIGDLIYMSSSEYSATEIWTQQMDTGTQGSDSKSGFFSVYPCRSFAGGVGEYAMRDIGPAGGWIFAYSGGLYYEAAPTDLVNIDWSNVIAVAVTGTGTAIGTGQANTTAIINQVGHTSSAAKLCDDFSVSGASPTNLQLAEWTDATHIRGIAISTLVLAQSQITGLVTALAAKSATVHSLINTTNHPVSGLTIGHFLKALSPTSYGFAAHGLNATAIGLGNVTNDAQVKKIASATNLAVARWNGTTGDLLKDSSVTVDDSGNVNIPTGAKYKINGTPISLYGGVAPFHAQAFATPTITLDGSMYKDFIIGTITNDTEIGITGTIDGDAGMVKIIVDGTGGYAITLGASFVNQLGITVIDNLANANNTVSWRNVGGSIEFTIGQVV